MTSSRSLLISVALGSAILGVTVPFSWHFFSVHAYQEKLAAKAAIEAKQKQKEYNEWHTQFWENMASKIRHLEKYRRANPQHIRFDGGYADFASPLQVIKADINNSELRQMDDDDVLELYRSWLYQNIPKDQFQIWGREPFGQEKIDAARERNRGRCSALARVRGIAPRCRLSLPRSERLPFFPPRCRSFPISHL
jgi:hypothetical protein